jgi:hypothetical protein
MLAALLTRHAKTLSRDKDLRNVTLAFAVVAFGAAGAAGFFGAFLNKFAPVRGGQTIHILKGEAP